MSEGRMLGKIIMIQKAAHNVKYRLWFFLLRLELFLLGIFIFNSGVVDYRGSGWAMERLLVLAAGMSLPFISIILSIPKVIEFLGVANQLETYSRYLVLSPLWCLVALVLVEAILRVTIYNPPFPIARTNWAGDIPAENSAVLWGWEGHATTHYWKWGEIQTPYYDEQIGNEVIVLGDSHTEGLHIEDDLKFPSIAETALRKDGYDADLHNLGRIGLAMADYISWIPAYQSIFQPKAIVVQITKDDFIEAFHQNQFNYFVLQKNKELKLVQTQDLSHGFNQRVRKQYYFIPQIEEIGYERWDLMQKSTKKDPDQKANPEPTENPNPGSTETTSSKPIESINPEVFLPELTEKQLQILINTSKGTPLILILLPSTPYISGDELQMTESEYDQMKEIIARHPEITIIDPLPEFEKLVSAGHLPRGFFNSEPGKGHLNKYGNEIVGQLLAKAIEQVLK
jgi:hypothetical protein